jgi:hypothetical protein
MNAKRLWLQIHIAFAISIVGVLALIHLVLGTFAWWPLVAVGWGAPLAIHVALASGLFGPGEK